MRSFFGRLLAWPKRWLALREDLPAFLCAASLLLFVGLAVAKWLAVGHAYQGAGLGERLAAWARTLPQECLSASVVLALGLVCVRGPALGPRTRWAAFVFLAAVLGAWVALAFINVEFYAALGSPLNYQIVLMAPGVARHLLLSGLSDRAGGLVALALFCLLLLAALPPATRHAAFWLRERPRGRMLPWAAVACFGAGGAGLYLLPAQDFRAATLRGMNAWAVLWPRAAQPDTDLAPPTAAETRALAALLGVERHDASQALAPLAGRKLNLLLVVWESVGLRYLASQHPLGEARTPHLDRLLAAGSLRLTQCFADSPLTVQSGWSLVTGMHPPARPLVFTYGKELPRQHGFLPLQLEAAGYRTAHFNASNIAIWGLDRVYDQAGWGVLEDKRNLPNAARFKEHAWGLEDDVVIERFGAWLEAERPGRPFCAMLWNIETHHPYTWHGMPEDLQRAPDREKFKAVIERSDAWLGRLHALLEKRGLLENTVIAIVGDHGEGLGRPPRPYDRAHSMLVFEDAIHVPLIFLHPGFKAAGNPGVDLPCTIADVCPTLLDLAGVPVPGELDGISLARPAAPRLVYSRSILWFPIAVRAGPYKLILSRAGAQPELYRPAEDPREERDLAAAEPQVAHVMLAAAIRYSAARYRMDPSFQFGFAITPQFAPGKPGADARPKVEDLLKPEE